MCCSLGKGRLSGRSRDHGRTKKGPSPLREEPHLIRSHTRTAVCRVRACVNTRRSDLGNPAASWPTRVEAVSFSCTPHLSRDPPGGELHDRRGRSICKGISVSTNRANPEADPDSVPRSKGVSAGAAAGDTADAAARDIAAVPAVEIIATAAVHLMSAAAVRCGLAEGEDAAEHLDLDEARRLITALAGLVTAAAPDLGSQHAAPLRDGLKSLQLAFREASTIPDAPGEGPGERFTGSVV